jgi:hypothetical protein
MIKQRMSETIYESDLDYFELPDPCTLTIGEEQQKHFMESNGMLHNGYPEEKCLCGHLTSQHLDCTDVCLNTGCVCESFVEEGYRVSMPKRENGQLVEKKKEKGKVAEVQEDQQLNKYIRTLSEM